MNTKDFIEAIENLNEDITAVHQALEAMTEDCIDHGKGRYTYVAEEADIELLIYVDRFNVPNIYIEDIKKMPWRD